MSTDPDIVSKLINHYSSIRRLIAANYHPTVDKEQALLRLAESEMWIGNGRRKEEGPPDLRRTTVINYGPQYQDGVLTNEQS